MKDLLPSSDQITTAIGLSPSAETVGARYPADKRPMQRAELMGSHSHTCNNGVVVHVWVRAEQFLARGSHQGKRYGLTLGEDKPRAEAALRRLLTEIEDGKFCRASERPPRFFETSPVGTLTLRELCDACLLEKRKLRGLKTAKTYQGRLSHVLDHIEASDAARRWPLARNIDRAYAIDLRAFLTRRQVTPNGRSGGHKRPMSTRQIRNTMHTLKMVFEWAVRADVRRLPVDFVNPITSDILGPMPLKDPLRAVALPLEVRLAMLERMDDWQFTNLAALLALPLRPEDASRALISDVDLVEGELRLGSHFGGCDQSKGKIDVTLPLPNALIELFRICIGQRAEGPLFLGRAQRRRRIERVIQTPNDLAELRAWFDQELHQSRRQIDAQADQKSVYHRLLKGLGGLTTDEIGKEIRKVFPKDSSARPYDLRHGVTQDMHDSGIRHLELRYLTAHTTRDILNEYVGLDPKTEIQKYYDRIATMLRLIEERARGFAAESRRTA
jgi:hypothetical protein